MGRKGGLSTSDQSSGGLSTGDQSSGERGKNSEGIVVDESTGMVVNESKDVD